MPVYLDYLKALILVFRVASHAPSRTQRQGMLDFMRGCGEVIRNAQTSGVNVVFDLAIYQEDYEERYVTGFLIDVELINQLHEYQVGFVISVYSAGEQRGRTTTISQ
jgi:hypothetical protein